MLSKIVVYNKDKIIRVGGLVLEFDYIEIGSTVSWVYFKDNIIAHFLITDAILI